MKKTLSLALLLLLSINYVSAIGKDSSGYFNLNGNTDVQYRYVTGVLQQYAETAASLADDKNGTLTLNTPEQTYVTLYIKNKSNYAGNISFNYKYTNGIFIINGTTRTETSGTYSHDLPSGDSLKIQLKGDPSKSYAVLNNFIYKSDKPFTNYSVNFITQETGSSINVSSDDVIGTTSVKSMISGNGTGTVTVGENNQLNQQVTLNVNVTAPSGKKLKGWYTKDGTTKSDIIWKGNPSSFILDKAVTYYAEFIDENTPLYIVKGDNIVYTDLKTATDAASAVNSKTVVVISSCQLPYGSYTIPTGITLLIPSDSYYTCDNTSAGPTCTTQYTSPSPYTTMTMEAGATMTVNGTLCVNGAMCSGTSGDGKAGAVTGKYGYIDMEEGSAITLSNGSALYCWGYISGNGAINAKSGAKVYENFQFTDFRGGTATNNIGSEAGWKEDENDNRTSYNKRVFPISQYFIQNIEAPLTINYGAEEYIVSNVYAKDAYNSTGSILFIGNDNQEALFKQAQDSKMTKQYNPISDMLSIDIEGNDTINLLCLKINTAYVASNYYTLPITNNMSINVNSGSLTTKYDMALLPGAEINVGKDAELVIGRKGDYIINNATKEILGPGSRFYVYDKDDYKAEFLYPTPTNTTVLGVNYSPTRTYNRCFSSLEDAKIAVAGKMTVNGDAYVTKGGANVYTIGDGSIKLNGTEKETETYQVTQNGTTVSFVTIAIKPLSARMRLGDADGNGTVNVSDQTAIINYLNDKTPSSFNSEAADIDGNGSITTGDVEALKNIILKK